MKQHLCTLLGLLLCLGLLSSATSQEIEADIQAFELDNGLRIIMVKQDFAPVIAFNLMFGVGGIDEPDGLGGLSHMVEHMAFKGTRSIGSYDLEAELEALSQVEVLTAMVEQARNSGASEDFLADLETQRAEALELAKSLASPNAVDQLFSANGAVGLNASTSHDRTDYTVALPANRLELWARVYADVLLNPVFRGFYEESDVVREERRQRSEDQPQGVLFEAFLSEAFKEHPYGRPIIGSAEEIDHYRMTEAMAYYKLYYHPNRAVLALVGDVDPERDLAIIDTYFGALPRGPELSRSIPQESPQIQARRNSVTFDAEPQMIVGWHKPTYPHHDAYVLDVIDSLLSNGRTSRLYKRLVLEERIAASVGTSSSFPGDREDNLFVVLATPRAPHTLEENEQALLEALERLKTEPVSPEELAKVTTQVRANFIRFLGSDEGLASTLAYYELFLGGWETIFDYPEKISSVTPEQIMEVAQRTFVSDNSTTTYLLPQAPFASDVADEDDTPAEAEASSETSEEGE